MQDFGCVPVYVVAEKRYCVAAKIVETFLDPPFNPLLKTPFISDTISKQEIANTLYDGLPEDVLNGFAAAYRRPSVESFSIDVIGTLQLLGKTPQVVENKNDSFNYYSIILLE